MYTLALCVRGFQPIPAVSADEAFATACDIHPDAIVTDVMLPEVSGVDLTARLRGDPRTTDASIIVLTGYASDSTRARVQDAGCDRFLLKPCLPETLAGEIRAVLASRHQMSGSGGGGQPTTGSNRPSG
jgi:DNA-binding response OmpR family regulator